MRKVALIYNPTSGGSGRKRLRKLESALAVMRGANVEAELVPTESRDQAGDLVRHAVDAGCDTVFACGGDGTIHNIVQVLATSEVALGILPMGTANALAHDLGLPLDPVAAARAALNAKPRRVALGRIGCLDLGGNPNARYFVISAGAGVDAHLFYKLLAGTKQRIGIAAYYLKAWHLWFTYPMTRFKTEYMADSQKEICAGVTELMCVRIRNFGGVLRELAPGASLDRDDLRVVLCKTASRLAYLSYVARGLLGRSRSIRGIELVYSSEVTCDYEVSSSSRTDSSKIYVEADGELIGTLPARIEMVPNALTLLAPSQ